MGQMIDFKRPDGGTTKAWLADAGEGRPAVIVIQEWWGLNGHIQQVADRFAAAGFTALAPDLYRGRLAADADEASHMMGALDFADATHQDIAGALAYLQARGIKVGVTGFCMGGALTIAAAARLQGLAAASCFYGIPPAEFADPAKVAIPFQGHFAAKDDWCTPALVDALQAKLPPSAEIHRYAADHAFFNDKRPEVYDAACAQQAWERTLGFFAKNLG